MSNRTATWKAHERRIAKQLNGTRLGATGKCNEDVSTDKLAIECKHRQSLPAWLSTALLKVRAHAGKDRTGIVILHELGKHNSLVLIGLNDFIKLTGQSVPAENVKTVD